MSQKPQFLKGTDTICAISKKILDFLRHVSLALFLSLLIRVIKTSLGRINYVRVFSTKNAEISKKIFDFLRYVASSFIVRGDPPPPAWKGESSWTMSNQRGCPSCEGHLLPWPHTSFAPLAIGCALY